MICNIIDFGDLFLKMLNLWTLYPPWLKNFKLSNISYAFSIDTNNTFLFFKMQGNYLKKRKKKKTLILLQLEFSKSFPCYSLCHKTLYEPHYISNGGWLVSEFANHWANIQHLKEKNRALWLYLNVPYYYFLRIKKYLHLCSCHL